MPSDPPSPVAAVRPEWAPDEDGAGGLSSGAPSGRILSGWGPALRWALFGLAVAVQLVALYWPRTPSEGGLPIDKVVHAAIFGAVMWTGVRAGVPARPLAAVLAVHAVVSELVQHFFLAHRDGDWRDSTADLAGVLIVTAILWRRRRPVRHSG